MSLAVLLLVAASFVMQLLFWSSLSTAIGAAAWATVTSLTLAIALGLSVYVLHERT